MIVEFMRLLIGVLLMAFHRPVADYALNLDHVFAAMFRSRGVSFPAPPRQTTMHTIYFCLGIFVCLLSLMRIYTSLPR
ncbi:MAG TPA: hypothetical protein VGC88_01450 [Terriglobales bacterium]|jgi:hypothetical protein